MKKSLLVFIFLISIIIPFNVFALTDDYVDKVHEIVDKKVEKDKINIYLFRGRGCPHCADEEEWLETIKDKYGEYINVYDFEVWYDVDNSKLYDKVKEVFDTHVTGVPFTVIGDKYYSGFSSSIESSMENKIKYYIEVEETEDSNSNQDSNNQNSNTVKKEKNNNIELPILGNVDVKEVSIPIVAIVLGFIDGFNPCAMWILLFLINMLFNIDNKKKSWILGITFLFVSGLVYFLSMLGINIVLSIVALKWIKILLAIFIFVAGILNLRKYIKTVKEEAGCTVVDNKKRKKISTKIKKILESKSFILAIAGISLLAISVNLIELACSLGFPVIFSEILAINEINGISRIIYLLVYIVFYMIDDIFVFTISMFTLQATGITNKYNKLCTLISSIIMIIMAILLIFKPDWLMLNF